MLVFLLIIKIRHLKYSFLFFRFQDIKSKVKSSKQKFKQMRQKLKKKHEKAQKSKQMNALVH